MGVVRYSSGAPGLASIAIFIGENPMNIVHALIGCAIAFVSAFALTWITGFSRTVSYLSFIYFVYHQDTFDLFSKKVVKSKDGTTNISSLYVIANKQAERRTKVDEELGIRIREEYFSKNKGIAQTNPHKVISIRRLSQKYKLSKPTVQKIINGTYKYCKKES